MEDLKTTDALELLIWDLLKEEGITKDDLNLVNLDIEFSPVITVKGGSPMKVIELRGGGYQVPDCPIVGQRPLTINELKVMRFRYLINRPRVHFKS